MTDQPRKEDRRIRQVKVVIGDEWVQHSFGRSVDEKTARERVMLIVNALLPVKP